MEVDASRIRRIALPYPCILIGSNQLNHALILLSPEFNAYIQMDVYVCALRVMSFCSRVWYWMRARTVHIAYAEGLIPWRDIYPRLHPPTALICHHHKYVGAGNPGCSHRFCAQALFDEHGDHHCYITIHLRRHEHDDRMLYLWLTLQ